MSHWIATIALYAAGIAPFALIGGVRAAGDAFRTWGGAASR